MHGPGSACRRVRFIASDADRSGFPVDALEDARTNSLIHINKLPCHFRNVHEKRIARSLALESICCVPNERRVNSKTYP